jgi:hypothetical protein
MAPASPVNEKSTAEKLRDEIRLRAYQLYLDREGRPGDPLGDWLQAEREILARRESAIDEASEESFPASDSPAY